MVKDNGGGAENLSSALRWVINKLAVVPRAQMLSTNLHRLEHHGLDEFLKGRLKTRLSCRWWVGRVHFVMTAESQMLGILLALEAGKYPPPPRQKRLWRKNRNLPFQG